MLVSHKVCFSVAFEHELTEDFADGSRHVEDTSRVVPDSDLIFSYLFGRTEKELQNYPNRQVAEELPNGFLIWLSDTLYGITYTKKESKKKKKNLKSAINFSDQTYNSSKSVPNWLGRGEDSR